MRRHERIGTDYQEIEYHQFTMSRAMRLSVRALGILSWLIVGPMALLARTSDFAFRALSELLALAPFGVGTILRQEFYRLTLRSCGDNVNIGFGTIFVYRDVEIGHDVLIGMYNVVHHCDFGSHVLTADGCRFLSGSQYHHFERTDVPMALQGGRVRRIRIADDCWIGANAVVMASVECGSIVGAGSVVSQAVDPWSVVAGSPARLLRSRQT